MGIKRCVFSLCGNNVKNNKQVNFYPFPRPKKNLQQCLRWISACGRFDDTLNLSNLSKFTHYLCSEHFVNGHPTVINPDPVPFQETEDSLKLLGNLIDDSCNSVHNPNNSNASLDADSGIQECSAQIKVELPDVEIIEPEKSIAIKNEILTAEKVFQKSLLLIKVEENDWDIQSYAELEQENNITEELDNSLDINITCTANEDLTVKNYQGEQNGSEKQNFQNYTKYLIQFFGGKAIPQGWTCSALEESIAFTKLDLRCGLIRRSFIINNYNSTGTVAINGKTLDDSHFLTKSLPEATNVESIIKLLDVIDSFPLCDGIFEHVLVEQFDSQLKVKGFKSFFTEAVHADNCDIVVRKPRAYNGKYDLNNKKMCINCLKYRKSLLKSTRSGKCKIPIEKPIKE